MYKLRHFLEYLWPELILKSTPWFDAWSRGHKKQFADRSKVFFILVGLTYIGHYYLVDIPNDKDPIEAWFIFRMTMASLASFCVAIYFVKPFVESKLVKWPAICAMSAGCITQAFVPLYFSEAPWFYPYLFVFASVLVLGTSPVKSLLFAVPVMLTYYYPLVSAGVPSYQLTSAMVVCMVVIFVVRTSYISDIRNYVLTQERDQYRGEIIELGKEFEDRLKSFIPRVISERLEHLIDNTKMTVIEATLNVLTPKKKPVACLWSDIRGFTQGSKDLDDFLADSVIPEVKVCSDAVERHEGIPRKIGDLIFAYFDSVENKLNLVRSLLAAFELSEINKDMNETVSTVEVKRFILISTGEALVGNLGGMNSGVEITALGSPVNLLARLDDATKEPGLANLLDPGDVILCPRSAKLLTELDGEIPCLRVCLKSEGVSIRDFPEVSDVFILRPSSESKNRLEAAQNSLTSSTIE